ncbi:Maf family protein [Sandaracinobacteroides saxicola]|uniref:Nucleoside triphosphate pyrophosphatase n=1 Tax=Sandaracinobacteroides saxicola TaxID=2759707 RepID=A0A7G5IH94_9SPHN|nr:Maf family protein [Sandaracinobacteroides saxicola]QMW22736.1 Maf family protein [Sandaracinobacteroides saxicola]
MELILASESASRRAMLLAAGVPVTCVGAQVDEGAIRDSLRAEGRRVRDVADALAEAKAVKVSRRHPGALVLGADSMLAFGDRHIDKAESIAAARDQLRALRGQPHSLVSAAVVALDGVPVWRHVGVARLVMRDFSDAFLEEYVAAEGEALLTTVGGYRLEGLGAQLFSAVEGDYFTVLGLPLLAVLGYLRERGVMAA